MALQSIGADGIPFPPIAATASGAPGLSTSIAITAAGHKAAHIFQAAVAKSIHKVHIRTGTVTTGDTVDVRVETVDNAANGDPTGTLWGTNTNGSLVIASSDDNVWKNVTLTADAVLAIGDVVALVVANGGGGGNMIFNAFQDHLVLHAYTDLFTAAWVKSTGSLLFVPEYSDGSFGPIAGYSGAGAPINSTTFNSGTATNRRGNIFQLPVPCRAAGCWGWIDADGDYTVKLYDSDGTSVLATTATINAFQRGSTAGGPTYHPFTTSATLAKATNYRIVVIPSTTTSLTTYDFDVPVAGMLDMFPGGQNCKASVYTSGAWVETATRRGYLGVMLDAFDDAVPVAAPIANNFRGGFIN